jgi:hypothetical protein
VFGFVEFQSFRLLCAAAQEMVYIRTEGEEAAGPLSMLLWSCLLLAVVPSLSLPCSLDVLSPSLCDSSESKAGSVDTSRAHSPLPGTFDGYCAWFLSLLSECADATGSGDSAYGGAGGAGRPQDAYDDQSYAEAKVRTLRLDCARCHMLPDAVRLPLVQRWT